MKHLIRHPFAAFREDFSDMTVPERVLLLAAMPVAGTVGFVAGIVGCILALTYLPY